MAKDNSGNLMVAFVVGALTGAAVALLFAPASGEETRRRLAWKAEDAIRTAHKAVDVAFRVEPGSALVFDTLMLHVLREGAQAELQLGEGARFYPSDAALATWMAPPPVKRDRLPALPKPLARSVSPCTMTILSGAMSSTSQTSCV